MLYTKSYHPKLVDVSASYHWPLSKPEPVSIERYMWGTPFPVTKQELIAYATGNEASEYILDILKRFEPKTYQNLEEVKEAFDNYQPLP